MGAGAVITIHFVFSQHRCHTLQKNKARIETGGNVYEITTRGVTCATNVTEKAAVAWLTCARVVCVTRARLLSTSFSTQSNTVANHSKHLARPYARCVRKSDARHKDSTTTAPWTNPRIRSVTLGGGGEGGGI